MSEVTWERCESCGREWPFPNPGAGDRDWQCDQCHRAEVMRTVRTLRQALLRVTLMLTAEDMARVAREALQE